MWATLLVLAICLSGVTLPPAQAGQQVTIFHTIYVKQVGNDIQYILSNETFLNMNFTEIFEEVQGYNLQIVNSSTIASFNGEIINIANITTINLNETFEENSTTSINETEVEAVEEAETCETLSETNSTQFYSKIEVSTVNTTINGKPTLVDTVKYAFANKNHTVIITTVAVPENKEKYSHVLTFLYYTDPWVNVSQWFGDWIILNFTHTLAQHYQYVAEALKYAAENIYAHQKDYYSQQLAKAYKVLSNLVAELHLKTLNELKYMNKPIEQSVCLAIDPLMSIAKSLFRKIGNIISGVKVTFNWWSGIKIWVHGHLAAKITFWHQTTWHYPWYRLHTVFDIPTPWGPLKIDAGLSLLPGGCSFAITGKGYEWLIHQLDEAGWHITLELGAGIIIGHLAAHVGVKLISMSGIPASGTGLLIAAGITAGVHGFVAWYMRSRAKKPIAWLYSAFAALICGLLDLRHFSWSQIKGFLKSAGRRVVGHSVLGLLFRKLGYKGITHIIYSLRPKRFSNNRAAEVTIGLTDVVLFAVFLGFYSLRW